MAVITKQCHGGLFLSLPVNTIFSRPYNGIALWSYYWSQNPLNLHWYYHTHHYYCDCPKLPPFSNSTSSADLSMALLILLQRLHNCLMFHRPCHFWNSATSRRGPSKVGNAMCDNPSSCFKTITLTDTEIPLFLWSVTQFFTSASRLGHFAACVQNGVYSSLISSFLPLAMSTHV
jgi:hypothetical protein